MTTNPFTYLRNKCGLTMRMFCGKYRFAKQTLIGIESGMYPELSDRMIETAKQMCADFDVNYESELQDAYDVSSIEVAYMQWVDAERGNANPSIRQYSPDQWTAEYSPMHFFIKNTTGSAQGFAKQLKIPPATLMRYVRGEQAIMPLSIEKALRAIDYPYMMQLVTNQMRWVEEHE